MPKFIIAAIAVLSLSGCAMTPERTAAIAGAVIITSIAISLADDDPQEPYRERKVCRIDGSVAHCWFE